MHRLAPQHVARERPGRTIRRHRDTHRRELSANHARTTATPTTRGARVAAHLALADVARATRAGHERQKFDHLKDRVLTEQPDHDHVPPTARALATEGPAIPPLGPQFERGKGGPERGESGWPSVDDCHRASVPRETGSPWSSPIARSLGCCTRLARAHSGHQPVESAVSRPSTNPPIRPTAKCRAP